MAKTAILSGNEAIARGAYEAGVQFASAYPGTPSTEVLETISRYKDELYCEWAPNEKVALEAAAGASFVGARALVAMKHVGLNVAADPLMTLSYVGTEGGLVVVVADDPGMHSSQNEQDSRNYARFAKIPVFEPSDSQEAKDFVMAAFELSERFKTPVLLRSTTRISHCRSIVRIGERVSSSHSSRFEKNPQRYVPVPVYGRKMRNRVEERFAKLGEYVDGCAQNKVIAQGNAYGIVTSSISFQYAAEQFPDSSILKLGLSYPFPDRLIEEFASQFGNEVVVIEELDNFLEEHIRSLGIKTRGKEYFSPVGELSPDKVARGRRRMEEKESIRVKEVEKENKEALSLPARPPIFCPGCPHRGLFYALSKVDCVVTGDIGCYSLGVFPPYERMDTILCMGGGITVAHGMDKAGFKDKPLVGIVGDSTFFHSGMTGLLEISYNKGISTIIVVDNRVTAMTGHQDHPGTGKTLMGEKTRTAYPEDIARACGVENMRVIDPLDYEETLEVLKEEVNRDAPSLIVARRPCVLLQKGGEPWQINEEQCSRCGRCLRIGCPAIYRQEGGIIRINTNLCSGCGFCARICPKDAVIAP